jgi:hypothetical protein
MAPLQMLNRSMVVYMVLLETTKQMIVMKWISGSSTHTRIHSNVQLMIQVQTNNVNALAKYIMAHYKATIHPEDL